VSKFFKALEKVEQERELAETPAAPERPAASAASVEAPVEPATAAAAVAATPATAPAPAVTPPPVQSAPAPAPAPAAAAAAPSVYGAPLARVGTGGRGFAWQLEGTIETEAGQIDDHLVSLLAPTSYAAEQYRAVRLAVETLHHERGTQVVALASPGRGEGRTMTALNLAGALAQASDARVALLEADLRHPAVARYLGLPAERGLSSYLLDTTMNVDAVLQRIPSIAFAVLPAGATSSMPYELLKSPRLVALLAELRQRYDYVLVDTPSALPFPDVSILRDLVDGFVVVARANRTPREQLNDTMALLGRPRMLGLVFNDDERSRVPSFDQSGELRWRRLMPGTARA
jgi:capsular exopolysaccharide synthesis family protein